MVGCCECWLVTDTADTEKQFFGYFDKDKKFRKPTKLEIAVDHYISVEQATDRAETVCTTMCGLRVCIDNYPDVRSNPDGHYGDRNGRKLNWVRFKGDRTATCTNCVAAQRDALFMGKPLKECAR